MAQYDNIYDQEMRRRKINEALLQKSTQPGGVYNVGGRAVPYSPYEGLSQIGQALIARQGIKSGEDRIEKARQEQEEKRKKAVEAIMQTYKGRPAETAPLLGPPQLPEGVQEISPEIKADPDAAIFQAATDPNIDNKGLSSVLAAMVKQKNGRGGYFTPKDIVVDGKTIPAVFDHRTGKWDIDESQGMLSPKYDQGVQKGLTKAKKTGEFEAEREYNMKGIGDTIDSARTILKEQDPTASGLGAGMDFIARQAGITSQGAQAAAKLEAIGGALISKMPRMEGPQSDKDVMVYRQMAAKVADRTIPVEERLAALDEVEALWRKYEPQDIPQNPAKEPQVLRFDAQGNPI